jgi:hypothetical protein
MAHFHDTIINMDANQNPKFDELLELTRENNKMLRGLRRAQRLAIVGRILYWLLLAVLAFGAYTYIEPYLGQLQNVYLGAQDFSSNMGNFQNFFNSQQSK